MDTPEKTISLLTEWTRKFGKELCPRAGYSDSFGDGMRAAKHTVARILDASNIRLIAAAPDLLVACRVALAALEREYPMGCACGSGTCPTCSTRAAIARAEGRGHDY